MRKESKTGFYHIFNRGVGRQIIFDDDNDRRLFIALMFKYCDVLQIHAWCLMSNHYHLVVKSEPAPLAAFMRKLNSVYASYYNQKYGHIGHLFQGKYKSQPIESESHLLSAIRYVHRNPLAAGLSETCEYPWSSYTDYLYGAGQTKTDFVLGLFASGKDFIEFHARQHIDNFDYFDDESFPHRSKTRPMPDSFACELAERRFGILWRNILPTFDKPKRTRALQILKAIGLTIRQIERLTGIGREIVRRAWATTSEKDITEAGIEPKAEDRLSIHETLESIISKGQRPAAFTLPVNILKDALPFTQTLASHV